MFMVRDERLKASIAPSSITKNMVLLHNMLSHSTIITHNYMAVKEKLVSEKEK